MTREEALADVVRKLEAWADQLDKTPSPVEAQHVRACALLVRDALALPADAPPPAELLVCGHPVSAWREEDTLSSAGVIQYCAICAGEIPAASPAELSDRDREFNRIVAASGTPTNPSQRLPAAILGRYRAGESISSLAEDYEIPEEQVEWGIRIAFLLETLAAVRASAAEDEEPKASA